MSPAARALRGTIVALGLAIAACGGGGGRGSLDLAVEPGGRVDDTLRIRTDVEGGELLSCDLATLVRSDAATAAALEVLEVELGSLARSDRTCLVPFVLVADRDAPPGEQRLRVKLFFTYRGPLGIESATGDGLIRVEILG